MLFRLLNQIANYPIAKGQTRGKLLPGLLNAGWVMGLIVGIFGGLMTQADLVIVSSKTADVYQHHRVCGALLQNEVVYAEKVKGDQDWLQVWMDGQPYLSRRKNFLSEADINIQYRRDKLFLENRLNQIDREQQSNLKRRNELRDYILEVEWDQTACYQTKIVITPQQITGAKGPSSRAVLMSGQTPPEIQYKYYDKIPLAKSRRLIRDWEKEIEKLDKRSRELNQDRRNLLSDRIANEMRYRATTNLLQRFLKNNRTYRQELHLVTTNQVSLFENRSKRTELEKGDLVIAQQDKRYMDRLEVLIDDKIYDSPRDSYQSWTDWEITDAIAIATINDQIAEVNHRIEELDRLTDNYQSFIDDLTYVAGLDEEYVYFRHQRNSSLHASQRAKYWVQIPRDGREMVHRPRANRLLRQWKTEVEAINSTIASKWQEIEELNQKLLAQEYNRNNTLIRSAALGFIGK
jgi:hypothetical protein